MGKGRGVRRRSATFGILDYAFTGAANPLDMTGGVRTAVFARKTPNHRGPGSPANELELKETDIEIGREGPGISMKIQAKDCAQGGVFQMEPERGDGSITDILHVLATRDEQANITAFYFDNPNFRAREGDTVPYKDTTVIVPARVNFANDFSRRFVGRDSPQVAARRLQGCPNRIQKRDATLVTVDHCGGVSLWRVESGGRMGMVLGEDATEVAPPATNCNRNARRRTGFAGDPWYSAFPFLCPATWRLNPRFPAGFQP